MRIFEHSSRSNLFTTLKRPILVLYLLIQITSLILFMNTILSNDGNLRKKQVFLNTSQSKMMSSQNPYVFDTNSLYISNSTIYKNYTEWPLALKVQAHVDAAKDGFFSLIFPAYNELIYATLTLESVINSTLPGILAEIILVDDGSSSPLNNAYDNKLYVPEFLKYERNEVQQGLIRSRLLGAKKSKGPYLMFMDFHVKPDNDWAPPLLQNMQENHKRVVVPAIPILNANWTIDHTAVGTKMFFDWGMHFFWVSTDDHIVPCMSGGIYAISREWWFKSGQLDPGMEEWGCENIEQSIRIWLCGGEIIVDRRSLVAHLFRAKFPYKVNREKYLKNCVRTAEVWLDEYKTLFYDAFPQSRIYEPEFRIPYTTDTFKVNPLIEKDEHFRGITERLALKSELNCKPFESYVEQFYNYFKTWQLIPKNTFIFQTFSKQLCTNISNIRNSSIESQIEFSASLEPCDAEHSTRWFLEDMKLLPADHPNKCLVPDPTLSRLMLTTQCSQEFQKLREWKVIEKKISLTIDNNSLCIFFDKLLGLILDNCYNQQSSEEKHLLIISYSRKKLVKLVST